MAKNEAYHGGRTFPMPAGSPTPSGTPLRISHLNCVAMTSIGDTIRGVVDTGIESGNYAGQVTVDTGGAYIVPVVVASAAMQPGDLVYITSGGTLTNVATSNTVWGIYIEPTSTPITTSPGAQCVVKIIPFTV